MKANPVNCPKGSESDRQKEKAVVVIAVCVYICERGGMYACMVGMYVLLDVYIDLGRYWILDMRRWSGYVVVGLVCGCGCGKSKP